MPSDRLIYWDACCFLSYLNGDADRIDVLQSLLEDSSKRNSPLKIVTSTISIVEVACAAAEAAGGADNDTLGDIEALWKDTQTVEQVEFDPFLAREARNLIRDGMRNGWTGLKAADAIHLASAKETGARAFHTYDLRRLKKYEPLIGRPVINPDLLHASQASRPPGSATAAVETDQTLDPEATA